MDLKTRLFDDMKTAMREKEVLRKELLQILRGGILQVEKDKQITLDEAGVLEVIQREHKKRVETLHDLAGKGGDFAEKTKAEMVILETYLPQQLNEAEITALVQAKMAETGAMGPRDMGKLMQALQPDIKGKADGKTVNRIVKELLG